MTLPVPNFIFKSLVICILLALLPSPAAAFGAGNIPGIAEIEGVNFRHGGRCFGLSRRYPRCWRCLDIEDMLRTVAFLKGHQWTTMMIKRVYFGNWLRDYSQAIDVGSLKGVSAPTIRILVTWFRSSWKIEGLRLFRSGFWAFYPLVMLRKNSRWQTIDLVSTGLKSTLIIQRTTRIIMMLDNMIPVSEAWCNQLSSTSILIPVWKII